MHCELSDEYLLYLSLSGNVVAIDLTIASSYTDFIRHINRAHPGFCDVSAPAGGERRRGTPHRPRIDGRGVTADIRKGGWAVALA